MSSIEKKSIDLLRDGRLNKSTAFTLEERKDLGITGLLPYTVSTQQLQVQRALDNMRRKPSDIEKYLFLLALQDRTERLFYKLVLEHVEEIMPLIYTPTVGQACKEFSHIFSRSKGFWITPDDVGHIAENLENWPEKDIRVIVITDGQRILGLGDLGANGMGIPIGKASLYTVCGGIPPAQCLPIMLDIGTNNPELLDDPLYIGYPQNRIEGQAYLDIVEEVVQAVQTRFPQAILQFEDFLTPNAYGLVGGSANAVAAGRRPLSSMTPTFLESADRIGILGTPGGSRIISMVLLGVLEFADGGDPQQMVSTSRYHHQYLPDQVEYEKGGLDTATQTALQAKGHKLNESKRRYGNMHAITWERASGVVKAASDPRGEGKAEVWTPAGK